MRRWTERQTNNFLTEFGQSVFDYLGYWNISTRKNYAQNCETFLRFCYTLNLINGLGVYSAELCKRWQKVVLALMESGAERERRYYARKLTLYKRHSYLGKNR